MADAREPQSNLLEAALRDISELYRELRTGPDGLSREEAEARLREFGPNELPSAKKPSAAEKVFAQARNLFNVLLIFAAVLSFPIGSRQVGIAILAVVAFNIAFNIVQEHRAEVVEALHRLIPANAKVTRNGQVIALPVSQIVPTLFDVPARCARRRDSGAVVLAVDSQRGLSPLLAPFNRHGARSRAGRCRFRDGTRR